MGTPAAKTSRARHVLSTLLLVREKEHDRIQTKDAGEITFKGCPIQNTTDTETRNARYLTIAGQRNVREASKISA
jgi:hypothetical protein